MKHSHRRVQNKLIEVEKPQIVHISSIGGCWFYMTICHLPKTMYSNYLLHIENSPSHRRLQNELHITKTTKSTAAYNISTNKKEE